MLRILREGDFLPDFELHGAHQRVHVSGLAGAAWILLVFRDAQTRAKFAEPLNPLTEIPPAGMPVVSAVYSPEHFTAGSDTGFYTFAADSVRDLLLGDDSTPREFSVLVIDRSLKIHRRIDDLSELTSPGRRDRALQVPEAPGDDGAALIPVLRVPNALSRRFCGELIDYFHNSEQIQGRTGQSSPQMNLDHKRSSHVNASREMAVEIDRRLLFSLLPAVERVFGVRVSHRGVYKVSCYDADQVGFFAPHRDNSDHGNLYSRLVLSLALNDDWEGDGICFPEFSDRSVNLSTGDAVVFPVSLLHGVGPIRSGKRFVILSPLYDEEAAKFRRSTMSKPELLDGIYNDHISDEMLAAYDEFAPAPRFSPQFDELETFAGVTAIRRSVSRHPGSAN